MTERQKGAEIPFRVVRHAKCRHMSAAYGKEDCSVKV
jgi:hypothetical protein